MDGLAPERPLSVSALLRHAGRNRGDREVVSRRVEGDLHRCGRAGLTARAGRAANALADAGIVPGDGVATLAWNGHRHVELAFAACGSGAILHALDPLLHPDRIVGIIDDVRARIVFFDLSFMPLVEEIAPRLGTARFVALTDRANMPGPAIANLLCYEEVIAGAADDFDWPDFDDRTIAALSSLAGRAEARDRARSALLPTVAALVPDELSPLAQDTVLSAVPLSHAEGWGLACAAWQAGAGLVLPGPWLDGGSLHALIEGEGVTVVAAGGLVWRGLLAHAEREGAALSGLRLAIVTGGGAEAEAAVGALGGLDGVRILRSPLPPPPAGGGTPARARR